MVAQVTDAERVTREQVEFWNDAAPGWKRMFTSGLERAAQHVSERLLELAQIKPGDRVLDIATGSGEPALTAARKVGPHGLVVATDQSAAMLEQARERAAALGLNNVKFVETGAAVLEVDEQGFNAALCRWGLMFVPDLDVAARRIAKLIVPGGAFATAVWATAEKTPMIGLGEDAVRALAKVPPTPPDAPHPLRLADTKPLERALDAAGFKEIHQERVNVRFEWKSAEDFTEQRRSLSAPFRALLAKQTPELQRRIIAAVTDSARAYADASGTVRMDNEAICIAARR